MIWPLISSLGGLDVQMLGVHVWMISLVVVIWLIWKEINNVALKVSPIHIIKEKIISWALIRKDLKGFMPETS